MEIVMEKVILYYLACELLALVLHESTGLPEETLSDWNAFKWQLVLKFTSYFTVVNFSLVEHSMIKQFLVCKFFYILYFIFRDYS